MGLLPALLGERMPGAGPVEATGNALGQGPVVFYLPQELVARICSRGQPRNDQQEDGEAGRKGRATPQAVGKLRQDLFRCCPPRTFIGLQAKQVSDHQTQAAPTSKFPAALSQCCTTRLVGLYGMEVLQASDQVVRPERQHTTKRAAGIHPDVAQSNTARLTLLDCSKSSVLMAKAL